MSADTVASRAVSDRTFLEQVLLFLRRERCGLPIPTGASKGTIGAGQNGVADNGYIRVPEWFKSRPSDSINAISRSGEPIGVSSAERVNPLLTGAVEAASRRAPACAAAGRHTVQRQAPNSLLTVQLLLLPSWPRDGLAGM